MCIFQKLAPSPRRHGLMRFGGRIPGSLSWPLAVTYSFRVNISPFFALASRGDWLPVVVVAWTVVWLCSLGSALSRQDFDATTRLTWVVVLIFVPFFGVFLYWGLSPNPPPKVPRRVIDPSNQLSGTPWEVDPGHTTKKS